MAKKKTRTKKTTTKKSLSTRLIILGSKLALLVLACIVAFMFFVYIGLFGTLPSIKELNHVDNQLASEVYASDGSLMGKYYHQNRMSIENKVISQNAINALIATEDSRFFEHEGYDPISLGRVLFRTIILGDTRQGGGSTISQQLAKNLYPRKSYGKFSIVINKSKEIFTASRLEQVYTKDEILTLYLNTVPFGEKVYGIEAASLRFFDKHSSDLAPNEAAVLIGMLAANTAYNPRLHPERSKQRRNTVIARMEKQGFLTPKEKEQYTSSDLNIKYHKIDHNGGIAPYFRDKIKQKAIKILDDKYGDHYNIHTDGLKIYTTIDPKLQQYAEEAVQQHMMDLQKQFKNHWRNRSPWKNSPEVFDRELKKSNHYKTLLAAGKKDEEIRQGMSTLQDMTIFSYPKERKVRLSAMDSISHYLKILNTGFMVMDPQSGEILSWVGGVSHKYFQYDHVTSRRQVGSTFKPIVYAAALENGMSPCDYISNERRVYAEYEDWSPANSDDFHEGYYSMKGGLTNSVNTITAEIMVQTGVDKVINLAQDMGITANLPAVPSLSLGTGEISLQEMLTAYSCFANNGIKSKPVGLLRIEDAKGNILYENTTTTSSMVFDKETADLMNYMLQGVIDSGTGKRLRTTYNLKSEIAGKTGTTQNNADGWFIAYNPHLLAGAWVGAESPKVHFRTTALGQGAHMALPIYGIFMQKLEADSKYNKYTKSSFNALPERQIKKLSCPDYVEKEPGKGFFDFMKSKEKEIPLVKPKESKEEKKNRKKDKKERRRLFKWRNRD